MKDVTVLSIQESVCEAKLGVIDFLIVNPRGAQVGLSCIANLVNRVTALSTSS